jgi:LPPG:FO 2-phospho-L-lactate transferase
VADPARVVVLAGGYGGAKLTHGLAMVAGASGWGGAPFELSAVVNTGDDLELLGLLVCPDLDTIMYTLAGLANDETGWGLRDETWSARGMLERYGQETWFALGDRDIATHLVRSKGMRTGARLTEVTAGLTEALGIATRLLPMTDDIVRTKLRTDDGWLSFQEYFVRRHHADEVHEVHFHGIEHCAPSDEVLEAIAHADRIVFAPSNPFVSIGTILAVPGIVDALHDAGAPIVAVSPLIGGAAVRGPADRMFDSLGGEASAVGVARHYLERYPGLLDGLVIDSIDEGHADALRAMGLACLVTPTLMLSDDDRRRLALEMLDFGDTLAG